MISLLKNLMINLLKLLGLILASFMVSILFLAMILFSDHSKKEQTKDDYYG